MKYFKNIIKAVISFGLLGYLIVDADPVRILDTLKLVLDAQGMWYILFAFCFALTSIWFMAIRWSILLRGYNQQISVRNLFEYYLMGLFFNNFLPTSIGGDIIRVYKIIEETGDRTLAFSGVILERIIGIAGTLFLAIVSIAFITQKLNSLRILYVSITLFFFIMLFLFVLIRHRPFELLLKLFEKITIFRIGEKINKLLESIHYFRKRRRVLIYAFFLSLFSQIAIVFMNYFAAKAFALDIDLLYLFMVVPVTFIITMLPSINGMGVREFGFIRLLSVIGVEKAGAISLSFVNFIIPVIISIWGAILFVFQKRKLKEGGFDAIKQSL